jgi:FAD/FMN-containing dehydrogenase
MPRGYEEGPVAEEAQRRIDAIERGESPDPRRTTGTRSAVFGATEENAPARFLGWADEVDPDELFASGRAWGISLRRIPHSET